MGGRYKHSVHNRCLLKKKKKKKDGVLLTVPRRRGCAHQGGPQREALGSVGRQREREKTVDQNLYYALRREVQAR